MRSLTILFLSFSFFAAPLRADWLTASQVTFGAANAADVATSYGQCCETNPVLGEGTFGKKQLAIKAVITTGLIAIQRPLVNRNPKLRKVFVITNFVTAGIFAGAATWNMGQRR